MDGCGGNAGFDQTYDYDLNPAHQNNDPINNREFAISLSYSVPRRRATLHSSTASVFPYLPSDLTHLCDFHGHIEVFSAM